jgi:hypothetical protein
MIRTKFNTAKFTKDMNNIVKYSEGFLEGAQKGKVVFLKGMGVKTVELLKQYIDSNARVNPEAMHHVYEWYRTGVSSARLFEINHTVSNLGLSFTSEFRQSTTIQNGSRTPFYNKAMIMESGMSVKIRPKAANVLAFNVDGEDVFTKNEVRVDSPGGSQVAGSFERVFDSFFTQYFTQSFLKSSGMFEFIENPIVYKRDLPAGKKLGKAKGLATGFRWVANAGVDV